MMVEKTKPKPAYIGGPVSGPLEPALEFFNRNWRQLITYIPYTWLLLFFLAPFLIILKISFADPIVAQPPYTPLFDWAEDAKHFIYVTFDNFKIVFTDILYRFSYFNSIKLAAMSTLLCLLIGYPMAYAIARAKPSVRNILLLLVILPFWTSFLLRVYAWLGLLNTNGIINTLLLNLGVIDAPLAMLYTPGAIYVGIVYSYLPFMILPLYANLEKMDWDLLDAASDLGAKPWQTFRDITLPLSVPGIIAGCLLVFIPAMGEFVIPFLLGGADKDSLMIGNILYQEFFFNRDWPIASAVAIVLLAILVVPIMLFQHFQARAAEAS